MLIVVVAFMVNYQHPACTQMSCRVNNVFALNHTDGDPFLLTPMILEEGCKEPRVKSNNSKFMKDLIT